MTTRPALTACDHSRRQRLSLPAAMSTRKRRALCASGITSRILAHSVIDVVESRASRRGRRAPRDWIGTPELLGNRLQRVADGLRFRALAAFQIVGRAPFLERPELVDMGQHEEDRGLAPLEARGEVVAQGVERLAVGLAVGSRRRDDPQHEIAVVGLVEQGGRLRRRPCRGRGCRSAAPPASPRASARRP